MICNICKDEVCGFATGNPKEDICSDCAMPMLKHAREAAKESLEINHWRETGEMKTAGELLRNAIGIQ